MEQRELGKSGITVSAVGLGCNNFGMFKDSKQAVACVHEALDAGITFFDMASEHGAGIEEELVGSALRGHRDEVVIATKVGQAELLGFSPGGRPEFSADLGRRGLSREWITRSVEESLGRLGTDYIDVYQTHTWDEEVSREETLGTLNDLVEQGKIRAVGEASTVSSADRLVESCDVSKAHGYKELCSAQAKYNLLARDVETDFIPELLRRGISLIPYMPLANGLLTGKYLRPDRYPEGSRLEKVPIIRGMVSGEDWEDLGDIATFAADHRLAMTHLAIAWLLSKPVVASVIAGASRPEQIRENVAAVEVALSAADLDELDAITSRRRAVINNAEKV